MSGNYAGASGLSYFHAPYGGGFGGDDPTAFRFDGRELGGEKGGLYRTQVDAASGAWQGAYLNFAAITPSGQAGAAALASRRDTGARGLPMRDRVFLRYRAFSCC